MKKRFYKMILCVSIVVAVLCSMSLQIVSADDTSYLLMGGKFEQGIENVTCKNNVNVADFPELYAAVEAAIVDWDWHLAILNERYNTNWNMTSISGSNAMIKFYAMSNAEATAYLREYSKNDEDVDLDELEIPPYSNPVGFASYWNDGNPIEEFTDPWDECVIVLLYENMSWQEILDDYYTLQIIVNHEIGHALGLDDYGDGYLDPNDPNDKEDFGVIMHPHYNSCTADVPTAADLIGIREIYA